MACCEEWKAQLQAADLKLHVGWEYFPDFGWTLNGCCGGGCFVLTGVTNCPFCGELLPGGP